MIFHSFIDLNQIIQKLSEIKPELTRKYSIESIGLFGSIVRDDFNEHSDIDIIVSFNQPIGIEFITLADDLERILNHKVELVSQGGIKQRYYDVIEQEIIYI